MTIKQIGTVTITEDRVFVEGFHFGAKRPASSNGVPRLALPPWKRSFGLRENWLRPCLNREEPFRAASMG